MVEEIEEFGAELRVEAFAETEILHDRKVDALEAEVTEGIAAHAAERAKRRRQHHAIAHHIATKHTERCGVTARRATVQGERFGGAGRIAVSREPGDTGSNGRLERGGRAEEVPAVHEFAGAADVGARVNGAPRLSAVDADDGVDLPTLKELREGLDVGNLVSEREGEAVAHVEVAAGIFVLRSGAIHGQAGTGAEIPVGADIVESMGVGVAHEETEPVIVTTGQSDLKGVVVGAIDVADLIDLRQEREWRVEWARVLFGATVGAGAADGGIII